MMELGPATREGYGDALLELGRENPRVVVLDADLSTSTMSARFGAQFPDRFFNLGIAEANMIGVAAGFAVAGKIPSPPASPASSWATASIRFGCPSPIPT